MRVRWLELRPTGMALGTQAAASIWRKGHFGSQGQTEPMKLTNFPKALDGNENLEMASCVPAERFSAHSFLHSRAEKYFAFSPRVNSGHEYSSCPK